MLKNYTPLLLLFTFYTLSSAGVKVGEKAPEFTVQTLDHGTLSLSKLRGKVVMLFFVGNT